MILIVEAVFLAMLLSTPTPAYYPPADACIQCHRAEVESYQRSQMASSALSKEFLIDWKNHNHSKTCLDCHSPSYADGIVCQDCHGVDGHNSTRLDEISLCARCHDAPAENTVRSFRDSPVAKQGQRCSTCHLDFENTGHEFLGPSTLGFMNGVAGMKLSIRKIHNDLRAIVQIRHLTGHALPGGTIGRSVWIMMDAIEVSCRVVDRQQVRFGWMKTQQGQMIDRSLPPGEISMVEFEEIPADNITGIRVRMIYRFAPGDLAQIDARQIVLDEQHYSISPSYNNCIDLPDGSRLTTR